ncbi:OLC1v1026248C1 [Oldenlandia corymbosa var. corymbosa]|uniref:OLC1v1026248C1 n=1 Tax=Oldenlandia corymbosa var. corymbosa TaxID=529605 RepID=A0AAV1C9M4_OLDCO|nr:OLC1v1026248C1 [Oldenlandia corymbosa var. corymbosa]
MADFNADNFMMMTIIPELPAPAAVEDSDSLHSIGQGDSFHFFSSDSSASHQNTEHSILNDASDFYMPSSIYDILDVPPSEDMLADQSYVPDFFIPNVPDYPPYHDISPGSVFYGFQSSIDSSDSESVSSGFIASVRNGSRAFVTASSDSSVEEGSLRRSSIPIATLGRRPFKKRGSRRSLSSISAPLPTQDDYPQTDSDADDFYMRARRAVSESDMPAPPHKPLNLQVLIMHQLQCLIAVAGPLEVVFLLDGEKRWMMLNLMSWTTLKLQKCQQIAEREVLKIHLPAWRDLERRELAMGWMRK